MAKTFNTNGLCYPAQHYMVNIDKRLGQIEGYIDERKYFILNRARQYGKTTTLNLLTERLSSRYTVFSLSFEGVGKVSFKEEAPFCRTICGLLYDTIYYGEVQGISDKLQEELEMISQTDESKADFRKLSNLISAICGENEKPIVLIIDEVDQASRYKPFQDFLGMLRNMYLRRTKRPAFQSVILSGMYDIKNLKFKIHSDEEYLYNSSWNIAENVELDMSFSAEEIAGMLEEYEGDYQTGMDIQEIARLIYDYTSGYPYLVSRICRLMDKRYRREQETWCGKGVAEAVKLLLKETNTLSEDMHKQLTDYPQLKKMLYAMLFQGQSYPYNQSSFEIGIGTMFGFLKEENGSVAVTNRIFETWMYQYFLMEDIMQSQIYQEAARTRSQCIENDELNMDLVLEKFLEHFMNIYGETDNEFRETEGRKLFLLYIKSIINGTGSFYIEARTRNQNRMDVIVEYHGRQYVIEMKIWNGEEYDSRGKEQLAEYLEYYQLQKGYLLSISKYKEVGVRQLTVKETPILEVTV